MKNESACPKCHAWVTVRKDGTVQKHTPGIGVVRKKKYGTTWPICEGSGQSVQRRSGEPR